MISTSFCPHRVSIITGHYGTGKTEFSVNLAMAMAAEGQQVMIADLDIVNPYFRSRERRAMLEQAGIQLISSSQAGSWPGSVPRSSKRTISSSMCSTPTGPRSGRPRTPSPI